MSKFLKYLKDPKVIFFMALLLVLLPDSCYAQLAADNLRQPMGDLKKEVFSWLFAVKLGAVAIGAIVAAVQQSLTTMGVCAGVAVGIHFFDNWLGDGAGALISAF